VLGTHSLVTGGSGFIGRHVVRALRERCHHVRVLDVKPPPDLIPDVEYVAGSILDRSCIRDALRGVDHVYHLAAITHLWTTRPDDFDSVNYVGSKQVLAAAREHGVARFVHCSSETVKPEGTAADMPGPYSRSKFLAEQAVRQAAEKGFPAIVIAPTVTLGPDDCNFTPGTAMLAGFLPKRVQFYLNCALNFVDVRDVALGMALAGESGRIGERYFLGGTNISIAELLALIERITRRKRMRIPIPGAVALLFAWWADTVATHLTHRPPIASIEGVRLGQRLRPISSDKAQRELGYATRPLDSTLRDAIDWLLHLQKHASGSSGPRK
jgi:dihydroflavonol-4-reductase